jgi:ABC-type sugar transport system ATPase subunit
MSSTSESPGPALALHEIVKTYGATQALRGVSLEIQPASVHALVGENGAGKSTALGVCAGRVVPDSGTVEVFGQPVRLGAPRAARAGGIAAIYQELTIVPALSAEANVFLGQPLARAGLLAESAMRTSYLALCESVGVTPLPPKTAAGRCSVAEQQLLEILRALVTDARIILFDEPTASLALSERDALMRLIRDLREGGITVVLVSHNLEEVMGISDEISVFRSGLLQASKRTGSWTKPRLVQSMLGGDTDPRLAAELADSTQVAARSPVRHDRRTILRAEGVTVPGGIDDVSFDLGEGEILGVGGLVGSGRTTLLRALAGLEPRSTGRLWIDGQEVRWPHTVRRALSLGIALVPEDRKGQGLALSMSATDNVVLSSLSGAARFGFLSNRRIEALARESARGLGFDASRLSDRAGNLSGGNQQKLLLARWRHRRPRVLLADEPTRGIDVGAKAEIMSVLESMAAEGTSIVIVSSELEEVAALSHRVIVLTEGRLAGTLDDAGEISVSNILHTAFRSQDRDGGFIHA